MEKDIEKAFEQQGAGSAQQSSRLIGIDTARALAIFGMFFVHAGPAAVFALTKPGPLFVWLATGHAAALFGLLAGVSLALMTGGARPLTDKALGQARKRIAIRAVMILTIGLALGCLEPRIGNILPFYALWFIIALPLLGLRLATLFKVTAAIMLILPLLGMVIRTPSSPFFIVFTAFSPEHAHRFFDLTREMIMRPGIIWHPAYWGDALFFYVIWGFFPLYAWLPFIVLGIAVGRLDLSKLAVQKRLVLGGATLAFAALGASLLALGPLGGAVPLRHELAAAAQHMPMLVAQHAPLSLANVHYMGGVPPGNHWQWGLVPFGHSETLFDVMISSGLAMTIVGLCLLAARKFSRALLPLATTGAMALTLYVMHIIVITLAWKNTEGTIGRGFILTAGGSVIALLWRARFRRGPLEGLVYHVARLTTRPSSANQK